MEKLHTQGLTPVSYYWPLEGRGSVALNALVGQKITLSFKGEIRCLHCARPLKKTYQSGYCFPCTQRLARCDLCILKPERCHYALGTCREPAWGQQYCLIPHVVYLSNTSGLKVGVTKGYSTHTRWADQGATQALVVLQAATRKAAGLAEVCIATHIADKTNWRKMLSGIAEPMDLKAYWQDTLYPQLSADLGQLEGLLPVEELKPFDIQYPVLNYPLKIQSIGFEKTSQVEGILWGIKGQYLLFEQGVLNIRKYVGYELELIF